MSQPDPCSFCGVVKAIVVRSPTTNCLICTDCVVQCVQIMSDEMKAEAARKAPPQP